MLTLSLSETLGFLDSRAIDWKSITIGLTVAKYLFTGYLSYRQLNHLSKKKPSAIVKSQFTTETIDKSYAYGTAKEKFSFWRRTFSLIENLAYLKYDLYAKIWSFSGNLLVNSAKYLPAALGGPITQSLVMFAIISAATQLLSLPLSYYSDFVLEEKFGFNKMTRKTWAIDEAKRFAIILPIVASVLSVLVKLVDVFGDQFIFSASLVFFGFQTLQVIIQPLLISVFYKIEPLENGELRKAIEDLALKLNFPLTRLYSLDASAKSSHSNAFFIGLPWTNQNIVIYDTLIKTNTVEEVVSVLGHELGHWKKGHMLLYIIADQLQVTANLLLFSGFIHNRSLFESFGFYGEMPTWPGLYLFNRLLPVLDCVINFALSLMYRKLEREADVFAKDLGYRDTLGSALLKLEKDNLGASSDDWLYSAFYHSHPGVSERLESIGYEPEVSQKKK